MHFRFSRHFLLHQTAEKRQKRKLVDAIFMSLWIHIQKNIRVSSLKTVGKETKLKNDWKMWTNGTYCPLPILYRLQACLQHVSIRVKAEALFIYVWILLEYPCKVRISTCHWGFPSSSSFRFWHILYQGVVFQLSLTCKIFPNKIWNNLLGQVIFQRRRWKWSTLLSRYSVFVLDLEIWVIAYFGKS